MASALGRLAGWVGRRLGDYLSRPAHVHSISSLVDQDKLLSSLRPGDVLLVDGQTRVSVAIKYLTQSTWSHAALYTGALPGLFDAQGTPCCFLEADIRDGVRAVGIGEFKGLHSRICRPTALGEDGVAVVIAYVRQRLGEQYDLKNVIDLARYLIPTPPVPTRWRRRMLALGSGDPTRAICSTLIAQAFQSVKYPILPIIEAVSSKNPLCPGCVEEVLHVRHHSLFVPRDFDLSPYFAVVKPHLVADFDYRRLAWGDQLVQRLSGTDPQQA